MAEERSVIIKLNFDVNDFTKQSVVLNREIEELNKNQKELVKQGQKGSVTFQQNKEKLTALNTALRENNKVIQNLNVANKAAAGSNEQLKAQLSILTLEYNGLSKEERETTVRGKELQEQVKTITDELKENEKSVGDNRRNVGNYAGAIKELKEELKEAKGALIAVTEQFGEGSPEYIAAAKRAGELNDKLQDINQTIKASTGEPLERLGGDVALLKDKVLSLDFKGISTQLNSLGETVRGISFKSLAQGSNGLGASFKKLAVSILTNPIFILAGVITAIVLAIKEYSDTVEQRAVKANERLSASIETNIQFQNDLIEISKNNNDLQLKLAQAQGKKEGDLFKLKRQMLDDDNRYRLEAQEEINKSIDELNRAINKTTDEENQKAIQEQINGLIDQKEENKKVLRNYNREVQILEAEQTTFLAEEEKKRTEKLIEEAKKRQEANKALLKQIEDQQIESIQSDDNRAFAKLALDNTRRIQDIKDSSASQKVKNDALKQNQILFEKEITDFNKAQAEKRAADLFKAGQDELKISSDFDALKKQALDKELSDKKLAEDLRVEIVKKSSQLQTDILNKELELKQKAIDFEIEKINSQGALFEADLLALQNLNSQKDLLNAEYAQKQVDTEKLTQEQIDQIHKDSLAKRAEEVNTKIEISRVLLGSLNDLMFIFSDNQQKNAEFSKSLALFQILLDTATAISGVVSSSTAGDPYTYALRVAAGIGTVIGSIAKAKALLSKDAPSGNQMQRFEDGGIAKSGIFGGKPHSSGGTKGYFDDGTKIEVERDELFAVVNKKSTGMLKGLSNINQAGGGVPFFKNGGTMKFADGGTFANSISNPIAERIDAMNQAAIIARNLPAPMVIVQDINDAQGVVASVKTRADI